ncbi:hypothetical protein [Flavicella sediminum]|uniref:hypothetical protein n=1 Tax=Flavicella sediminum TaxID=2585141 RepID=UPI0011211C1F|nr:hypothetical protein [Flavicella sediminum]
MEKLNIEEIRSQNDILFHIENLKKDFKTSQYNANRNRGIYLAYESHFKRLILIEELICKKTRFPWMEIQNEMDLLHGLDKTISGHNITFDYKPEATHRGQIIYKHYNNNPLKL